MPTLARADGAMPTTYQRSQQAIFSQVGSDIVALNVERGAYYGMEEVTACVWELLATPQTLDQLCARLVEIYDVDPSACRTDVEALLETFEAEELIERNTVSA